MQNKPLEITDADLHAFVDGQLDTARYNAIWNALQADQTLLKRVQQYRSINHGLTVLSQAIDTSPTPDWLLQSALGRNRDRKTYPWAAIFVLTSGVLGFLFGNTLPAHFAKSKQGFDLATQLAQPAAIAHAIYTPEIKHPVEVTADQEAHLVAWLSKRLQSDIKAPQLGQLGYDLVGGRLLPATQRGAAQFMYENRQGERLTLYIRQGVWQNPESVFRYTDSDNVRTLYWIDGSMGYALSGQVSKQTLLRLGEAVYSQLTATPSSSQAPIQRLRQTSQ